MASRLGEVINWIGCLIAVLLVPLGGYFLYLRFDIIPILMIVIGLIAYGVGRASRYVLSGY